MFRTFSLLILISLGYFTTDIYLPSLPAIGEEFSASNGVVQLSLFSYMFSFAAMPLLFGPLSDQIGRKKVILMGLYFLLAGTAGCYFSTSIYWLISMRFLQGIGGGAIIISSRAMIPDLLTGADIAKQVSQISMLMPLALALGPLVGGFLQDHFGWRSVFLFLFFYQALVLLKMRFVDETLQIFKQRKMVQAGASYQELLTNKLFVLTVAGVAFPSVGLFSYLVVGSFLFQDLLGLTASAYGVLSVFIGGAVMLSSFTNRRLLNHYPVEKLLWVGMALMIAAGASLLFFHAAGKVTPTTLLISTLIYFACLPFCIGNSISRAVTIIDRSFGAAGALMTASQYFAGALGILIFTRLSQTSVLPLALCFLMTGTATGCAFIAGRRLQKS